MSRLLSGLAGTLVKGGLLIGFGAFILEQSIYTVEPGHRAVIFDRLRLSGPKMTAVGEGAHFLVPLLQTPNILDVRTDFKTLSSQTGTKDLQMVNLSLRVLYRPDVEFLPEIYKTLGRDYANRVLPPVGNEVLKAIVAQYNVDQLLTLRDQISREVREALRERCAQYHILLEDVAITELHFSEDFMHAIEDKQVAEQMAERAKFVVAKAEQERQALIIRSEGDAEAARLVSESISTHGRGLIEIRRIEAAVNIAETLSRARGNITYLPKHGNVLLNLPSSNSE